MENKNVCYNQQICSGEEELDSIVCKENEDNIEIISPKIFIKRDVVISSFIVPWIVGVGCKTPEQAKEYIKRGTTLNPNYFPLNKKEITTNGEEQVYSRFMTLLFNDNNIDRELSRIVGENVFTPWDCLSGIYQYEITDKVGLIARPVGVTLNNECIVMEDKFLIKFIRIDAKEEIRIKLWSTMVVWGAKRGVYILHKMRKVIRLDFEQTEWDKISTKIKIWCEYIDTTSLR